MIARHQNADRQRRMLARRRAFSLALAAVTGSAIGFTIITIIQEVAK
jgi:hypothetical protein